MYQETTISMYVITLYLLAGVHAGLVRDRVWSLAKPARIWFNSYCKRVYSVKIVLTPNSLLLTPNYYLLTINPLLLTPNY